jgi:hypothetical protein
MRAPKVGDRVQWWRGDWRGVIVGVRDLVQGWEVDLMVFNYSKGQEFGRYVGTWAYYGEPGSEPFRIISQDGEP